MQWHFIVANQEPLNIFFFIFEADQTTVTTPLFVLYEKDKLSIECLAEAYETPCSEKRARIHPSLPLSIHPSVHLSISLLS